MTTDYQLSTIDAHVHFWNYDPANPEFEWIGDGMDKIKRSFLPTDLIQNATFSIQHFNCIAVQAAPSWEETEFLLRLGGQYSFIRGVVGWIDLSRFNSHLLPLNSTLLKGFRHILQDQPYGALAKDQFRYFISRLKNYDYTYDLLIKPHQLDEALALVQEFPHQKFVLDHLAKPDIRNQDFEMWKKDIREFKNLPNVYCKISGMITEAFWDGWKFSDFTTPLDTVFETFGMDRLMYGSDWPVCLLAGTYKNTVDILGDYVSRLSTNEQQALFYSNAETFYNV